MLLPWLSVEVRMHMISILPPSEAVGAYLIGGFDDGNK